MALSAVVTAKHTCGVVISLKWSNSRRNEKNFKKKFRSFLMSVLDMVGQAALYGFAWLAISAGATVMIAAAFFGIKEEKNLEENQHDLLIIVFACFFKHV